jgi:hypothetical protein
MSVLGVQINKMHKSHEYYVHQSVHKEKYLVIFLLN